MFWGIMVQSFESLVSIMILETMIFNSIMILAKHQQTKPKECKQGVCHTMALPFTL
jgi:hypothetical protein